MTTTKKCTACDFKKEVKIKDQTFFSFTVKFEGDDNSYNYLAKDKGDPKFKVGEEQEVEITEKSGVNEHGDEWKIYNVKPAQKAFNKGGFVKKGKQEYLADAVSISASYAKDLVVAGKIEIKDFTTYWDKIFAHAEEKFNKIYP